MDWKVKSAPTHGDSHGVRGQGVQQDSWTQVSSVGCSGGALQVDIFVRGFVLFLAVAMCPLSLLEAVTEPRPQATMHLLAQSSHPLTRPPK